MLARLIREIFRRRFDNSIESNSSSVPTSEAIEPQTLNVIFEIQKWSKKYLEATSAQRHKVLIEFWNWAEANNSKEAWSQLGDWHLERNDLEAAETAYRQALRCDPRFPNAQEGLGSVLLSKKQLGQAYFHFETANLYRPFHAPTLNQWGLVCLEQGNLGEAAKYFEQAIEADSSNHQAWHNLGLISIFTGHPTEGIRHFERAISIRPKFGLAYSNLALALRDANKLAEALQAADVATQLKSNSPRSWVIAADIAIDAGLFEQAQECAQKALVIAPNDAGAHIVTAKLLTQLREYQEAKQHYHLAIEADPQNPDAEGGLGQLELLLGEWELGWFHYEARRRTIPPSIRSFGLPLWDGSLSPDIHLLIYAEQGLGDIILFASCLPDLYQEAKRNGARITLETDTRLSDLMARSFPELNVIGRDPRANEHDWLEHIGCTHEVPIGSLPHRFRSNATQFPSQVGYLKVDPQKIRQWTHAFNQRFGANRPIVALTWRGGTLKSGSVQRSMDLLTMLQNLQVPAGAGLILLQHGDVADELQALPEIWRDRCWHVPDATRNLDDAAAITCAVHAVVTVCGTQAHLAGALGQPGAVLVPRNPNWRYGCTGPHTPWYPSLQLFRQSDTNDWMETLVEVQHWLDARLANYVT